MCDLGPLLLCSCCTEESPIVITDGDFVGECDGPGVGRLVGPGEGAFEGLAVGAADGDFAGGCT